jgi:hypothetical protein
VSYRITDQAKRELRAELKRMKRARLRAKARKA